MFGAKYPIILSPMGGVGTPELAAAVCNAGGLGSLAGAYLTPDELRRQIAATRALTDQPFAVNLFVHETEPLNQDSTSVMELLAKYHQELGIAPPQLPVRPAERFDDQLEVVLDERLSVFSFTFGIPDGQAMERLRAKDIKTVGTATTVAEAVALSDAGVDAIVAQGAEAGAHRGTFLGSFEDAMVRTAELIVEIAKAVPELVIAAGGVRTGQEIAAMLRRGAFAVQIGTAFIPCPESKAPEVYKQALLAGAKPGDTVITRAFSGRPARGLTNRFIREMEQLGSHVLPFPWQNAATRPLRTEAARAGRAEFLSLWAGEGSRPLRQMPAAELMRVLVDEAGL